MRRQLAALALTAVALFATPALAQPGYRGPDLAAQRTAMERLQPLVGRWEGTAEVRGEHAMTVHQVENVTTDLDGLVLIFRGNGYSNAEHSGAPIFQALGVTSFNERTRQYELRTYTGGHSTNATAEFLADGAFRWGFDAGPVKMRFTIWFTATTWREVGEMSTDGGTTWRETIELNLRRVA